LWGKCFSFFSSFFSFKTINIVYPYLIWCYSFIILLNSQKNSYKSGFGVNSAIEKDNEIHSLKIISYRKKFPPESLFLTAFLTYSLHRINKCNKMSYFSLQLCRCILHTYITQLFQSVLSISSYPSRYVSFFTHHTHIFPFYFWKVEY
jgi:hypothetical protein